MNPMEVADLFDETEELFLKVEKAKVEMTLAFEDLKEAFFELDSGDTKDVRLSLRTAILAMRESRDVYVAAVRALSAFQTNLCTALSE